MVEGATLETVTPIPYDVVNDLKGDYKINTVSCLTWLAVFETLTFTLGCAVVLDFNLVVS